MIDTKAVKKQLSFCVELMERLNSDMREDINASDYYGVRNYTQKKTDIVRLRRELHKLDKLLYPY